MNKNYVESIGGMTDALCKNKRKDAWLDEWDDEGVVFKMAVGPQKDIGIIIKNGDDHTSSSELMYITIHYKDGEMMTYELEGLMPFARLVRNVDSLASVLVGQGGGVCGMRESSSEEDIQTCQLAIDDLRTFCI